MGEFRRPTRVVVVDADNPMEEVRGEFYWREDHERTLAAARDDAYRAGYADGQAAASRRPLPALVRVRVVRRRRLVLRAAMLFVAVAFFATLTGSFLR